MADHDQSIYNLRYNQINNEIEGFGGGTPQWTTLNIVNVDPTQVPTTRTISTTAPLAGGGDLSMNRTLSIPAATSSVDGYLAHADWSTFNSKQAAGNYITALTGDVTASGPGSVSATLTNTAVTGQALTGFVSGAGTVSATDTILSAVDKLDGNIALKAPIASPTFTTSATAPHYLATDTTNQLILGTTRTVTISATQPASSSRTYTIPDQGANANIVGDKASYTLAGTMTFSKTPVLPTVAYTASTGSPVTPDATGITVYNVTLDAALTINGPSSGYAGQKILFQLHNGAGSDVATFATTAGNFRFGADITSYTATASKTDYVGAVWNATDSFWDIVSLIQGF